jgi:hypothetical protein
MLWAMPAGERRYIITTTITKGPDYSISTSN